MNEKTIEILVSEKRLRPKRADKKQIESLIIAASSNAEVVMNIKLNDKSSTVVFREVYESIRQLGEAVWLIEGYEPLDHDVTLEILKEIKIKNSVKLNFLGRFKKIRHEANYRGYTISLSQAREIINFWRMVNQEIIDVLDSKLK